VSAPDAFAPNLPRSPSARTPQSRTPGPLAWPTPAPRTGPARPNFRRGDLFNSKAPPRMNILTIREFFADTATYHHFSLSPESAGMLHRFASSAVVLNRLVLSLSQKRCQYPSSPRTNTLV